MCLVRVLTTGCLVVAAVHHQLCEGCNLISRGPLPVRQVYILFISINEIFSKFLYFIHCRGFATYTWPAFAHLMRAFVYIVVVVILMVWAKPVWYISYLCLSLCVWFVYWTRYMNALCLCLCLYVYMLCSALVCACVDVCCCVWNIWVLHCTNVSLYLYLYLWDYPT